MLCDVNFKMPIRLRKMPPLTLALKPETMVQCFVPDSSRDWRQTTCGIQKVRANSNAAMVVKLGNQGTALVLTHRCELYCLCMHNVQ